MLLYLTRVLSQSRRRADVLLGDVPGQPALVIRYDRQSGVFEFYGAGAGRRVASPADHVRDHVVEASFRVGGTGEFNRLNDAWKRSENGARTNSSLPRDSRRPIDTIAARVRTRTDDRRRAGIVTRQIVSKPFEVDTKS